MNPGLHEMTEKLCHRSFRWPQQDGNQPKTLRGSCDGVCFALASDPDPEPRPGPFSMGLIATREFDMWGDNPELALLINRIQTEAERTLRR
jgi:hypothetical protein